MTGEVGLTERYSLCIKCNDLMSYDEILKKGKLISKVAQGINVYQWKCNSGHKVKAIIVLDKNKKM